MNVSAPVDMVPEVEQHSIVSSLPNADATGCLSLFLHVIFCPACTAQTPNNETST